MRKLLLASFLFFVSLIYSQNHTYSAKSIRTLYAFRLASDNDQGSPLGKNVHIGYDSFFKTYKISYTDIEGEVVKFTLKYVENGTPGAAPTNDFYYKVKDEIKTKKRLEIELTSKDIQSYILDGVTLLK